jgi:3-mercaptopyruvate sulfurtransferase SseA
MRKILLSLLLWSLWSVTYARPDFLVDADWLAEHIDDENLVVLEVRYHPLRCYTVGHIPGAVNIVSLHGTDAQSQKWLSDEGLAESYKHFPTTRRYTSTVMMISA